MSIFYLECFIFVFVRLTKDNSEYVKVLYLALIKIVTLHFKYIVCKNILNKLKIKLEKIKIFKISYY
jgi:hypothetical protein